MSDEPTRWKDAEDAPAHVRVLLREGNRVPPLRAEVRAAVLSRIQGPPPATAATAKALSPALTVGGAIAVVGIVVAGAVVARTETPEPRRDPPAPFAAPASASPAAAAPSEPSAPEPSATAPPSRSASPVRSRTPAARTTGSADAVETLREESELVQRARKSLVGDPQAALDAVEEHARRFPRGELAPERDVLRIGALHRLGRSDEARAHGQAYLKAYPESPHVPRVRKILAELDAR